MITPLNTEYNRMTSILEQYGRVQIDFIKTGVIYFLWIPTEGEPWKVKCDENLFKRNFRYTENLTETTTFFSRDEKKAYLDYPYGLIKRKAG